MVNHLEDLRPGPLTPLAPRPGEFDRAWTRGRRRRMTTAGLTAAASLALLAGAGMVAASLTSADRSSRQEITPVTPTPAPSAAPPKLHLPAQGIAVDSGKSVSLYGLDGRLITSVGNASLVGDWQTSFLPVISTKSGSLAVLTGGTVGFRDDVPNASPQLLDGCQFIDAWQQHGIEVCNHASGSVQPAQLRLTTVGGAPRVLASSANPPVNARYTGRWEYGLVSPSHRFVLGQWSGECEAPSTYFVDTRTGRRVPAAGGVQAIGLGWTSNDLAVVNLPALDCGKSSQAPGVYLIRPFDGSIVKKILSAPGTATAAMWDSTSAWGNAVRAINEVQSFLDSWATQGLATSSRRYLVSGEQVPQGAPVELHLVGGSVRYYYLQSWSSADNFTLFVSLNLRFDKQPDGTLGWSNATNDRFVTFTRPNATSQWVLSIATGP